MSNAAAEMIRQREQEAEALKAPTMQPCEEWPEKVAYGHCLAFVQIAKHTAFDKWRNVKGFDSLLRRMSRVQHDPKIDPWAVNHHTRMRACFDRWVAETLDGQTGDGRKALIRRINEFLMTVGHAVADELNAYAEAERRRTFERYEHGPPVLSHLLPAPGDGDLTRAEKLATWAKAKILAELRRRQGEWYYCEVDLDLIRSEQKLIAELSKLHSTAPDRIDELSAALAELAGEVTPVDAPLVRLVRSERDDRAGEDAADYVANTRKKLMDLRSGWTRFESENMSVVRLALSMLDAAQERQNVKVFFQIAEERAAKWRSG